MRVFREDNMVWVHVYTHDREDVLSFAVDNDSVLWLTHPSYKVLTVKQDDKRCDVFIERKKKKVE